MPSSSERADGARLTLSLRLSARLSHNAILAGAVPAKAGKCAVEYYLRNTSLSPKGENGQKLPTKNPHPKRPLNNAIYT